MARLAAIAAAELVVAFAVARCLFDVAAKGLAFAFGESESRVFPCSARAGEFRTRRPLSAAAATACSVPYGTEMGIGELSCGRLRDCSGGELPWAAIC